MNTRLLFLLVLSKLIHAQASAQVFTVNGNASPYSSCNCFKLTNNLATQSGSVWNNNLIDLSSSFDYNFEVFLGCSDGGADGIAFMLQPLSTSVGSVGGGLGYTGIAPSMAVEIDTWINGWDSIAVDHIGLSINGVSTHDQGLPLVPATPTAANIEDCIYHDFNIIWDAPTQTITVFFDGNLRFSHTYPFSIVDSIFSGNPLVYWGFTGSTGGAWNEQRFCIKYTPLYATTTGSLYYCNQTTVDFSDASVSGLNAITDWAWNFDDGTPIVNLQNPSHTFVAFGQYDVSLIITDLSGCLDTITQVVTLNPTPSATAVVSNETCNYSNNGQIQLSSINPGVGPWAIQSTPFILFNPVSAAAYTATNLTAGSYTITLFNDSSNCYSPPYVLTITQPTEVPPPVPNDTIYCQYDAAQPINALATNSLFWGTTLGATFNASAPLPNTNTTGMQQYYVTQQLGACFSDTLSLVVNIIGSPTLDAGSDQVVLLGTSTVLYPFSTATTFSWSPAAGLNDATLANPTCTPTSDTWYSLTATNTNGCKVVDSLFVKVSEDNVAVPNAFSPDGDNINDELVIFAFGSTVLDFKIFNRWGEVVYNYQPNSDLKWDGNLNGVAQPLGSYIYLLKVLNYKNDQKTYSGNVALVR